VVSTAATSIRMPHLPWNRETPTLLVIDKAVGVTSHEIVKRVRRLAHLSQIGHAGTLDPAATGVLVLCLGSATRLAEYLTGHAKEYVATITLGVETETCDADGAVTARHEVDVTRERLEAAMAQFRGPIEQRPPAYSAVRVNGKRAHRLARKGVEIDLPQRAVTVHRFELEEYDSPHLTVTIECSAGTYVRSLAYDLGRQLGCGAHVSALRRTRSGHLSLADAHSLSALEAAVELDPSGDCLESFLIPVTRGLADWPEVRVREAHLESVIHGNPIPLPVDLERGTARWCRIHDEHGALLAVAEFTPDGLVQPRKVLR